MFRFTIRDLLWLMVVVGLVVALIVTRQQATTLRSSLQSEIARNELISELNQPTHIDFVALPLGDVAAYLSAMHKIPFALDANVNSNLPITSTFKSVPLRVALQGMLAPYDLDFRIKEGAVQIQANQTANR
jgi:hypothetical protein